MTAHVPGEVSNPSSWTNPWREELNALFLPLSLARRPALRRSSRPDYLFATDLPSFASAPCRDLFRESALRLGWDILECGGWFHLRKADSSAPPGWFPAEPRGEAACLRALLQRHPDRQAPASELLLPLLKAREQGEETWEKACRTLHRELARRLREGIPFPRFPGLTVPDTPADG